MFFTTDVSAPIQSTRHLLTLLGEFAGFGLALVPDVVVLEVDRTKPKSHFNYLPWPGFEPRTLQFNGRERYH